MEKQTETSSPVLRDAQLALTSAKHGIVMEQPTDFKHETSSQNMENELERPHDGFEGRIDDHSIPTHRSPKHEDTPPGFSNSLTELPSTTASGLETGLYPSSANGGDGDKGQSSGSYGDKELMARRRRVWDDWEGGWKGASSVAGCWCILFATFGYSYTFGVFQDYYTRVYLTNETPSTISWIGGVQITLPFLMGTVIGRLFDRGYFRSLEIVGGALSCFSLFMLSLAREFQFYQIFLSQGIGAGLGFGLMFVPCIALQTRYFKRRRALAMGIVLSGNSIGGVIFPIMLNNLFKTHSFGEAVRASVYIVLGLVVLGNLLIWPPPAAPTNLNPPPGTPARTESTQSVWVYFQEAPYVLLLINTFLAVFGLYFPVIYGQLYAVQHRVDPTLAFYVLPILNGSSAIGRIVSNIFADWFGVINTLLGCTLASGLFIWLILIISDAATVIVISILYGFFSGAFLSLLTLGIASLCRTPQEIGIRTGIATTVTTFGTLFSAPIQGALLGEGFRWIGPIAFAASAIFTGAIFILAVRQLLVRERGTQKV